MVSIAEARNQLTVLIRQIETDQPTIISRRGNPVVVVMDRPVVGVSSND